MFHSARIKLTCWYLLIIVIVSLIFSLAIYRGLIFEIERGLRMQSRRNILRERIEKNLPPPSDLFEELKGEDKLLFEEAKQRVITDLFLVNLGIFIISGGLSYFLAGKTLKPIEDMVEDQKRFIADASHELRTPLTTMKTEIEVTLRDKLFDLQQAQKLAKTLGIKLGKIVNVVESTPGYVSPNYASKMALSSAGGLGGAADSSAQFEPGSQTISSVVTLYFEKK